MQKLTRVLSQMGGTLWLLGLAAIGAMLLAGRSLASDTTINFDNLPSGTQITNQYANQGIIFGVSPNSANDFGVTIVAAASGKAQSSPNVALITQGCSVEVRTVSAWAQFSQPHQKVSAFVGDLNGQSISVTIDTFDINGNAISGASLTQPL